MLVDLVAQPMTLNEAQTPERVRNRLRRLNIAIKRTLDPKKRESLTAEVDRLCGTRLPPTV